MIRADSSCRRQSATIHTDDGVTLGGELFLPTGDRIGCLLINSGTGIPQRFYSRFAEHAASRGWVTLTFDYRGIGASAPPRLRGYKARYRDWGRHDIAAAIDYLRQHYPNLAIAALGHSTGGQQLGLAHNVSQVRAALFVAVSTGYWRGMGFLYRYFTLALWRAWMPLAIRLYGYAPVRKIRWGEDLPADVAREWGAWCLQPDYMAAFFDGTGRLRTPDGAKFGPIHFDDVRIPILSYYFTDDPISVAANVPPLLQIYRHAAIETRWIDPREIGTRHLGHTGFFHDQHGRPLWDETLDWLQSRIAR
ncbi:MAG: alpha/beta fold hydrolase [Steroidobacteraceae bacterium]